MKNKLDPRTRDAINKALAKYQHAREQAKDERKLIVKLQQEVDDITSAQKIVQEISQTIQQKAHKQISDIVTRCLRAVFDDPYEFQIHFEQKRGKTEASLVFVRDGKEIEPMDAAGGGVIDVAAFALRVACIMYTYPATMRVLVLDEPFRFVSEDYRARIKQMMEELSKECGMQFIMVTHHKDLISGTVVRL